MQRSLQVTPNFRSDMLSCGLARKDMDYPQPSPFQPLPPWSVLPFSTEAEGRHLSTFLPTADGLFHIYTDGSKTAFTTGYAILIVNKEGILDLIQRRLENDCSIFEAETRAISEALLSCRKNIPPGSVIKIFTDSRQAVSQQPQQQGFCGLLVSSNRT